MRHLSWHLPPARLPPEHVLTQHHSAAALLLQIPKIPMPPPYVKGIRLQDGLDVTEELHNTLADMLQHMNAAIDTLPDLRLTAKATKL